MRVVFLTRILLCYISVKERNLGDEKLGKIEEARENHEGEVMMERSEKREGMLKGEKK